jgi:hypothetical protein
VSAEVKTLFLATAANFLSGPAPSPSPVLSTPAIIGISVGAGSALLILFVVLMVFFLYIRPRQKKKHASGVPDTKTEVTQKHPLAARQRARKITPVPEAPSVHVEVQV